MPGAKDWEDLLKDPSGRGVYDTFEQAARSRGLLEGEDELRLAMVDAAAWQMPSQLRSFFANLLLNSEPGTPAGDLWHEFSDCLIEDYTRRGTPREVALDLALQDILHILEKRGRQNSEYAGLPDPQNFDREAWLNADIVAEMRYSPDEEKSLAAGMRAAMYEVQAQAFDDVIAAVKAAEGGIFFVDGPGGTGKSFLFEAIIHQSQALSKNCR